MLRRMTFHCPMENGKRNVSCREIFFLPYLPGGPVEASFKDTESAAKPPKAEKSGAEKSEPAGAYFSAPDVSAFGFRLETRVRQREAPKVRRFSQVWSAIGSMKSLREAKILEKNLRGKQRFWLIGTQRSCVF